MAYNSCTSLLAFSQACWSPPPHWWEWWRAPAPWVSPSRAGPTLASPYQELSRSRWAKKKRWRPFSAVVLLRHHFLYANAASGISRWLFVFNSMQTNAQKYVFCWSWKSLKILARRTGLFEAGRVFCILPIAARKGDEILLLLSFRPVRVPGWALSCPPLESTRHRPLYGVSGAAVVFEHPSGATALAPRPAHPLRSRRGGASLKKNSLVIAKEP